MSERPERAWAAAKAMYEKETGSKWTDLSVGHQDQIKWLVLANLALDAADEYSFGLSS
jgi:hypothetical protein